MRRLGLLMACFGALIATTGCGSSDVANVPRPRAVGVEHDFVRAVARKGWGHARKAKCGDVDAGWRCDGLVYFEDGSALLVDGFIKYSDGDPIVLLRRHVGGTADWVKGSA